MAGERLWPVADRATRVFWRVVGRKIDLSEDTWLQAPTAVRDLAFSPDGRQLSVTLGTLPDIPRLWRLNADGQNAQPLRFNWPTDAGQHSGQWTPDAVSEERRQALLPRDAAPEWNALVASRGYRDARRMLEF